MKLPVVFSGHGSTGRILDRLLLHAKLLPYRIAWHLFLLRDWLLRELFPLKEAFRVSLRYCNERFGDNRRNFQGSLPF